VNFHQSLVAALQAAKVDSDDLAKAMKRAMNVQVEHFASCCLYRQAGHNLRFCGRRILKSIGCIIG
jgi:hypothetical protein